MINLENEIKILNLALTFACTKLSEEYGNTSDQWREHMLSLARCAKLLSDKAEADRECSQQSQ